MKIKKIMKQIIKKLIVCAKNFLKKRNYYAAQKNTFGLSKKDIKKANRLGFTADEYVYLDLEHNNPKDYISEYERYRFRDEVKEYRILLDNKIIFYELIKNFTNTNKIYAYKQSGRFVALEAGYEIQELMERLTEKKILVYKSLTAGGGRGFRLLSYENGKYYINRKKVSQEQVHELIYHEDDYLIEEYCEQGDFATSIWPYSVNTIRIITLNYDGEIKVAFATQRFGVEEESCVDNACAGGISAVIDVQSGVLHSARRAQGKLFDDDGNALIFDNHPVTLKRIKGEKVPNWSEVTEGVKKLHEKLLFTKIDFIAWDIALLDSGYKVIEANTSCGTCILQTDGGVRNKEIGQWMKSRGYIK